MMARGGRFSSGPSWVRLTGILVIISAVLEIFTSVFLEIVFPEALVPGTSDAALVTDIVITYLILGLIGVIGLYLLYHDSFGWIGNLGLLAIAIGAIVGIAATLVTAMPTGDLFNWIVVFGGAGLLAGGLWRTPRIPRIAAVLMAVTPIAAGLTIVGLAIAPTSPFTLIAYLTLNVTWGGAWIVIGYHLMTVSTIRPRARLNADLIVPATYSAVEFRP